jgi:hypothetical protein
LLQLMSILKEFNIHKNKIQIISRRNDNDKITIIRSETGF